MIEQVPDLGLDRKTYYETMFVVSFFAVNVTLESSVVLSLKTAGKTLDTNTEKNFFSASYITVSLLYLISYLCYINILQAVWSFKHKIYFDCPILNK